MNNYRVLLLISIFSRSLIVASAADIPPAHLAVLWATRKVLNVDPADNERVHPPLGDTPAKFIQTVCGFDATQYQGYQAEGGSYTFATPHASPILAMLLALSRSDCTIFTRDLPAKLVGYILGAQEQQRNVVERMKTNLPSQLSIISQIAPVAPRVYLPDPMEPYRYVTPDGKTTDAAARILVNRGVPVYVASSIHQRKPLIDAMTSYIKGNFWRCGERDKGIIMEAATLRDDSTGFQGSVTIRALGSVLYEGKPIESEWDQILKTHFHPYNPATTSALAQALRGLSLLQHRREPCPVHDSRASVTSFDDYYSDLPEKLDEIAGLLATGSSCKDCDHGSQHSGDDDALVDGE